MNPTLQVLLIAVIIGTSLISATVVQKDPTSSRVRRQWGGSQGSEYQNSNNFREGGGQSNCQTTGINIVGLPLSSYNCQDSAQSASVSQQQGGAQGSGFIGGLLKR